MNRNKTIIGIIIICIDQLTKNLVQVFDADVNIINNFLRIKYVQNTGAAFSMFKGHTTILILVSIVLLVLVYNLMFSYKETKLNNLSFGLIIGGIIGNLIDRIFFQCVRDFIDINIFNFPIFNIADMAIVFGIVLLLISSFMEGKNEHSSRKWRLFTKNR